jgi:hypothetical protein
MIVHLWKLVLSTVATHRIYHLSQAAALTCPVLTGNHSDSKSDLGTMDEQNHFVKNRTPLTTYQLYLKLHVRSC